MGLAQGHVIPRLGCCADRLADGAGSFVIVALHNIPLLK
jgi:hypothetical protein